MKIQLAVAFIAALTFSAVHAQTNSTSSATTSSGAQANGHQANTQAITFNTPASPSATTETVRGSETLHNTPDLVQGAYAPSMSSDSCMTTSQVGVSVAGVGVAGGHGSPDDVCRRLRAAEKHGQIASEMHMLGRDDVALYQMELAETDACLADGFKLEDCQRTAHDSIYPPKH
jgi:hypothetical protein